MKRPNALTRPTPYALACASALLLIAGSAYAGRPLNVDDASVNDKGKGHVEAWVTRADGLSLYSLAPAYAPIEGLEIGGLVARENETKIKLSGLQAKWRITPSQDKGCNVGAVLGFTRASASGASVSGQALTGLFTCNGIAGGSAHLNVGLDRIRGGDTTNRWGLAYERSVDGITPHIEWYGSEGSKPTVGIGVRGMVTDSLQLDGSVGRGDGVTIYTLGAKLVF
jgi:hypothetical protein